MWRDISREKNILEETGILRTNYFTIISSILCLFLGTASGNPGRRASTFYIAKNDPEIVTDSPALATFKHCDYRSVTPQSVLCSARNGFIHARQAF